MIQFENSEHTVIIKDAFVETIIKTAQWWKERINDNIDEHIIKEVVEQMEDGTKYISIHFEVDNDTAVELGHYTNALSLIIRKENITLRNKVKKVKIKKGSVYERLNGDPKFIDALTEVYNSESASYLYYFLPVSYTANLVSKDGKAQKAINLSVDIPFSDVEVI